MNLTDDDVRDILRLLDSLPYAELRLETDSFGLWLRRADDGEWTQATRVRSAPNEVEQDEAESRSDGDGGEPSTPSRPPERSADSPGAAREGLVEVRAPLLGTFYRAPRPGADPFVEVGGGVEEDTVVGIIETMKLMNSVPAGVRGTVVEICVANAEFAERDAVLMLVAPE